MITEKNKIYNAAYDLIYRNIRDNPNKIAFIDNNNKITYNELYNKIKAFSSSIRNVNIDVNDRVIICMEDKSVLRSTLLGIFS